jgi:serine phosphatase RsbU (regulator of sigma subunit)/anti-sigma regulatory factor (Ser/Thr protein kinase)
MRAKSELDQRDVPTAPTSSVARYLFALVAMAAGLLATIALFEAGVSDQPIYAPMIGAVAFAGWYGGFGPSLLAIVLGWGVAVWALVSPRGGSAFDDTEDATRWWVNLAVAVVIAGASSLLRWRQERVARELVATRTSMGEVEALQELSVALAGTISSEDVARAVTANAGEVVTSDAVALGLVDGDQIVVVGRSGATGEPVPERLRVPLDHPGLLARAVRDGSTAQAETPRSAVSRDEAGDAAGPFAVPIRVSTGEIAGAIEFRFGPGRDATPEALGLARVVSDLAGQALERARLYERERESRQALERIVELAPRFLVDEEGGVLESVCREARITFGADFGVLWRVGDGWIELLAMDPVLPDIRPGVRLSLDDFPRLGEAIRTLGTSFVPDVRESTSGEGREFVDRLGIRSSLRTPVVIGGRSELVLAISWHAVLSEPDPATRAVVRRFADQAGLVLEQLERRRAEAEAGRRADATRRLQAVTAGLSTAVTALDVSTTCLEHALETVGAEAGFIVLTGPEGTRTIELVTSTGYDDDQLESWRLLGLDDDVPFARAIASGESIWALDPQSMSAFTGVTEAGAAGWITIPLPTARGYRGALHISLREPRTISDDEREWLETMVSQCGQALERSGLYHDEQRSRLRAEQLQSITARLSNALTSAEVGEVAVEELADVFEASSVVLVGVADGQIAGVLSERGDGSERLAPLLDLHQGSPAGQAMRTFRSVVVESREALVEEYPELRGAVAGETFLALPLVAARRMSGLLVAAWEQTRPWASEDRAVVEALAGQAAQALARAGRYETEQAIAETLQRSVLPDSLPRVEGVELAARYMPGSRQLDVGGDWFDALSLPDGRLGLVVGDVVGKGVRAAASMAQLRNAIRAFSVEHLKPSSAIARLNRLCLDVLDAAFATVVYVTFDPATGTCRLASAGHPPPLVAYPDGRIELLESVRGLPLGAAADARYRQESIQLPAGSVLVLYTDGLVERRGRSIDDGIDALRAAVATSPTDPDRLLDHIIETVVGGREREDDVAMLAARVLPVAPHLLDLKIPSDVSAMPLVRDAVRAWLTGTELERAQCEGVVLATWEACANAIEHAVDPHDAFVRVRADAADSRLRIVIEDTGSWSDSPSGADRGFGLRLIESLVTSVAVSRNGPGTTVTLEQHLGAEPTDVD